MTYDAIVVGGGHNGLVAAFYLARGGMRPLVLERRDIVGGACVTEEFAPGFRASTGAYVLSMLREAIWEDMRLVQRGVVVDPAGPSLYLFPDGRRLLIGEDQEETCRAIAEFSAADALAFPGFEADLAALAKVITPMIDWTPPDPRRPLRDLGAFLKLGGTGARHREAVVDALYLFATSARQFLDERFESEHVKAALGWHAINDSVLGPSSPGTAYVLLHDHATEDPGGGVRQWGFVRGGIGRVTEYMADAAREAGASIRVNAPVAEILVDDAGAARGVRLASGEELLAPIVLSNADPKHTFLDLVDGARLPASFVAALKAYRCIGTSVKINLAVNALPHAAGVERPADDAVAASYLGGIMEVGGSLSELDRAQAQALAGQLGTDPHIELCIPTVHDPSLAPAGHHIVTIDINSQPYALADGDWDALKEGVADQAIATLERSFPGLTASIVHRQVLSPLDLERVLGLTGGHALHGDMSFDQLFVLRPVRGWADYRTPIAGLYLCGAGTHPGGGVTGANGHNAAREVLRDARGGIVGRVREKVGR